MKSLACSALLAAFAAAAPAQTPHAVVVTAAAESPRGGEPRIERIVIDDGRARIEELRVRGALQKVTVEPRGRFPNYEIITGDGSRDLGEGANTSRGATGKRVWNVFQF